MDTLTMIDLLEALNLKHRCALDAIGDAMEGLERLIHMVDADGYAFRQLRIAVEKLDEAAGIALELAGGLESAPIGIEVGTAEHVQAGGLSLDVFTSTQTPKPIFGFLQEWEV